MDEWRHMTPPSSTCHATPRGLEELSEEELMCFKFVGFGTGKCVLCALLQTDIDISPQIPSWRAIRHLLALGSCTHKLIVTKLANDRYWSLPPYPTLSVSSGLHRAHALRSLRSRRVERGEEGVYIPKFQYPTLHPSL